MLLTRQEKKKKKTQPLILEQKAKTYTEQEKLTLLKIELSICIMVIPPQDK